MNVWIWLLAASVVVTPLTGWYIKERSIHRERHRQCLEPFYKASQALVDTEHPLPESVLRLIEGLYRDVRNDRLPWRFVWSLATGRIRRASKDERARVNHLHDDITSLGEDRAHLTRLAIVSGVLAITYRSVIAGTILRRAALYAMSMEDQRVSGSGEAEWLYLGSRSGVHEDDRLITA